MVNRIGPYLTDEKAVTVVPTKADEETETQPSQNGFTQFAHPEPMDASNLLDDGDNDDHDEPFGVPGYGDDDEDETGDVEMVRGPKELFQLAEKVATATDDSSVLAVGRAVYYRLPNGKVMMLAELDDVEGVDDDPVMWDTDVIINVGNKGFAGPVKNLPDISPKLFKASSWSHIIEDDETDDTE